MSPPTCLSCPLWTDVVGSDLCRLQDRIMTIRIVEEAWHIGSAHSGLTEHARHRS